MLEPLVWVFALYGVYRFLRGTKKTHTLLFNDREGNSGRYGHWNGQKGYYDK
jgi:hypothetical protein